MIDSPRNYFVMVGGTKILTVLLFIMSINLSAQASVDYLIDVVKRSKISHVEFKNTPLREVLNFLQERSVELDTYSDPTMRGFSIILYTGSSKSKTGDTPITLELNDVSFDVALRHAAALAGMKCLVESYAVFITPLNWKLPKRAGNANIPEVMKRVIIPKLEFLDTPLNEAWTFLQRMSVELDVMEQDHAKKGIEIIVQSDSERLQEEVKITMKLRNVPLLVALDYTAALAGMHCKVESRTVYPALTAE